MDPKRISGPRNFTYEVLNKYLMDTKRGSRGRNFAYEVLNKYLILLGKSLTYY